MSGDSSLRIRPLTAASWPDLAGLFDEGGDPRFCSCMYWRERGGAFNASTSAENRLRFKARVDEGEPPGLVAYVGPRAVGWVSLGPRGEFERLERSKLIPRIDPDGVWSIVCFAVSRGYRGRGITAALLQAAIDHARTAGARALEAYPVDVGERRIPAAAAYTGTLATFERAGFRLVEMTRSVSCGLPRALVRMDLATRAE